MCRPVAPPLARGWSRARHRQRSVYGRSPARAGMVPSAAVRPMSPMPLPRSRGDGPAAQGWSYASSDAPPLARGWSLTDAGLVCGRERSPARAGMVPRRRSRPLRWLALPRSRGDGPSIHADKAFFIRAPPLARGWSPRSQSGRACASRSPARAGMVPIRTGTRSRPWTLPRSRGDGPFFALKAPPPVAAPPLARGWSTATHRRARWVQRSPARAGMVPRSCADAALREALPRSRGDGPLSSHPQ